MSAPKKRPRETVVLEFQNNALLAGLAGPHQKHFVRMEQKLGVRVGMRGNIVSIEGPLRERAAGVLRALYARLEAGETVGATSLARRALSSACVCASSSAVSHAR